MHVLHESSFLFVHEVMFMVVYCLLCFYTWWEDGRAITAIVVMSLKIHLLKPANNIWQRTCVVNLSDWWRSNPRAAEHWYWGGAIIHICMFYNWNHLCLRMILNEYKNIALPPNYQCSVKIIYICHCKNHLHLLALAYWITFIKK